ncbi:hypothetical protein HRbin35_00566 [bacterium HR35]|nr:hypothetical protein HRbin35_00566 [bacterium HR35]
MITIYTLGHSTRKLEKLIDVLKIFKIEVLADIRHFPHSRHNPQFNKEVLENELPKQEIEYIWLEKLGGFRKGGYLEYTKTEEFKEGLEELIKIAKNKQAAIMCAEILWFKCHRRFVSDELMKLGFKVLHIYNKDKVQEHSLRENKIKCD